MYCRSLRSLNDYIRLMMKRFYTDEWLISYSASSTMHELSPTGLMWAKIITLICHDLHTHQIANPAEYFTEISTSYTALSTKIVNTLSAVSRPVVHFPRLVEYIYYKEHWSCSGGSWVFSHYLISCISCVVDKLSGDWRWWPLGEAVFWLWGFDCRVVTESHK